MTHTGVLRFTSWRVYEGMFQDLTSLVFIFYIFPFGTSLNSMGRSTNETNYVQKP